MPLLLVALLLFVFLALAGVFLLSFLLRYRASTARRRGRRWVATTNVWMTGLSALFLLFFAALLCEGHDDPNRNGATQSVKKLFGMIYVSHVYHGCGSFGLGASAQRNTRFGQRSDVSPKTSVEVSDNTRVPGARKFPVLVLRERFCYDDDFDCMELDDIISFHDLVSEEKAPASGGRKGMNVGAGKKIPSSCLPRRKPWRKQDVGAGMRALGRCARSAHGHAQV